MYISMRNHEHYYDPTAGLALRAIMRKERNKHRVPSAFKVWNGEGAEPSNDDAAAGIIEKKYRKGEDALKHKSEERHVAIDSGVATTNTRIQELEAIT